MVKEEEKNALFRRHGWGGQGGHKPCGAFYFVRRGGGRKVGHRIYMGLQGEVACEKNAP